MFRLDKTQNKRDTESDFVQLEFSNSEKWVRGIDIKSLLLSFSFILDPLSLSFVHRPSPLPDFYDLVCRSVSFSVKLRLLGK